MYLAPSLHERIDRMAAALHEQAGIAWFRAPGTLHLVGEHSDGFALTGALDQDCVVGCVPSDDPALIEVELVDAGESAAANLAEDNIFGGGDRLLVPADGSAVPDDMPAGWGRDIAAVVRALADRGTTPGGCRMLVSLTVPAGSGLGAAAALQLAVAQALANTVGVRLDQADLPLVARAAHDLARGAGGRPLDALASARGLADTLLLLDGRDLSCQSARVPEHLGIVVVHSGTPLTWHVPEQMETHMADESRRAVAAFTAIRDGDLDQLGVVISESHSSLRSLGLATDEVDELATHLVEAGALTARATGGGDGGCVVALVADDDALEVAQRGCDAYFADTGIEPTLFIPRLMDGASPLTDVPHG